MFQSLFEELIYAGRGTFQLLLGRRDASNNFDLSLRGLAGSFVAFLAAATFNAFLPRVLGVQDAPSATQALVFVLVLYLAQAGLAALVLRSFGRSEGLVPYLVCDNWTTFFLSIASALMVGFGLNGDAALLVLGIAVIVIEINIARLIVTLRPLQIVGFLFAQVIGVMVGLMIIGAFLPQELLDQASTANSIGG